MDVGRLVDRGVCAAMGPRPQTISLPLARDDRGLRFVFDECEFRPLRDCHGVDPRLDDVRLRIGLCESRVRPHLRL